MSGLSIRRVTEADRLVAERLWLMFRHDMSEFGGQLPNPDGSFRCERLESALIDPDWAGYLILGGEHPVGIAFVRNLSASARVLNTFFVVRGARRAGVGLRAVRLVIAEHPGQWQVAFQDANEKAVSFWRRVATEVSGSNWTEERRPVAGHPSAPPDVWISFDASGS